ncbi:N-acetyltransferase family protein [Falsiroseomonas sp. CW058]|uniref:GNAT family N-acetyltransferase n=1 Tax=Falsiroseomonas sp. CW058 TaxID=3388664 RepID=UPI003D319299
MSLSAPPPGIRIRPVGGAEAATLVPALADILTDCVAGGASVGFMWPLARARAEAFWRGVAEDVATGARVLLLAEEAGGGPVGTVQLVPAPQENQPHRAEIAKMLVHRRARGRGTGAALMRAAEAAARARGRTLLVLDTEAGSAADRLYRRLGWTHLGTVPRYALMPDGSACPAAFFYRDLGR